MREKSTLFACKLAYTSVEGDDLSAIGHNCKAIFFSILFFPSGSIFDRKVKDTNKRVKYQKREEKTKKKTKDACKLAYKSISSFCDCLLAICCDSDVLSSLLRYLTASGSIFDH